MLPSRIRTRDARGSLAVIAIAPALLACVILASCDDPQAPAPGPGVGTGFSGVYDPSGGALEFRIETQGGDDSSLRLVASNLSYDPATQELHASVAIRNTGSQAVPGPRGVAVGSFDPESVAPTNAEQLACPLCPMCPCPFPFLFVHEGTYGEDGVLGPGETSTPIEWIFHDPSGESFSFRALLAGNAQDPPTGTISGSVFVDANADGHRQSSETGIAAAVVTLVHGDVVSRATTGERGGFEFEVSEPGLYDVSREPASDCDPTTPNRIQILIVQRPDGTLSGYAGAEFGCRGAGGGAVVEGIVYEDLNRDGQPQPGEPGLPNIRIALRTPNCMPIEPVETYTNERGYYRLPLGTCPPPYAIGHDPVPGYIDTSPNPVVFGLQRDPLLRADFGVARPDSTQESSVEGVVFDDSNFNGARDPGEKGIPNVAVTAGGIDCLTPIAGIAYTDAEGHYVLRQSDVHCFPPWRVGRGPIEGACDTSPNPVDVGYDRRPDPRHYVVDFGVAPCDSVPPSQGVAIDGVVFADLNHDGKRDPAEPGVPAAVLELLTTCDDLRTAISGRDGYYRFDARVVAACPVGAVHLREPRFAAHTTPNPAPFPGAPAGQALVTIDFGVIPGR
jgi:hypothetical protein